MAPAGRVTALRLSRPSTERVGSSSLKLLPISIETLPVPRKGFSHCLLAKTAARSLDRAAPVQRASGWRYPSMYSPRALAALQVFLNLGGGGPYSVYGLPELRRHTAKFLTPVAQFPGLIHVHPGSICWSAIRQIVCHVIGPISTSQGPRGSPGSVS